MFAVGVAPGLANRVFVFAAAAMVAGDLGVAMLQPYFCTGPSPALFFTKVLLEQDGVLKSQLVLEPRGFPQICIYGFWSGVAPTFPLRLHFPKVCGTLFPIGAVLLPIGEIGPLMK